MPNGQGMKGLPLIHHSMNSISGVSLTLPAAPQRPPVACCHHDHAPKEGFAPGEPTVTVSKPVFTSAVSTQIPNAASLAKTSEQFALRVSSELTRMPCNKCGGTGLCQNDFPRAGSGKQANGNTEPLCEGSGQCYYCHGTGEL